MQQLGPMYTLFPITAAFPSFEPIVTNCERLQLSPITVLGF